MDIKELLPGVQENVSLAPYTTFQIGGKAKYFFIAETKDEIIQAAEAAKQLGLPFFILAGGSNVLFSDKGFDGLIIKIENKKYEIKNHSQKSKIIIAESGMKLSELIKLSLEESLTGLEWARGIPGTVGGAIRGNAGAFKHNIAEVIEKIEAFDVDGGESRVFLREDCQFDYRNSLFKKNKNLIILSAEILLQKKDKEEIQRQMEEYINYRRKHHPLEFPSAGSVFANCELQTVNHRLFEKYSELEKFRKQGIIPAGFLIEKSGLKGKKIGKAQISEKHCNFIVNLGGAKAKDVLDLIKLAKERVREKFKIDLKEEIAIVID